MGTAIFWSKLSGGKGQGMTLNKFHIEQSKLINVRKRHGCLSWLWKKSQKVQALLPTPAFRGQLALRPAAVAVTPLPCCVLTKGRAVVQQQRVGRVTPGHVPLCHSSPLTPGTGASH